MSMPDAPDPQPPKGSSDAAPRQRRIPPQFWFGIAAATIEVAVILWFMYA
jgi:hypothetical protein